MNAANHAVAVADFPGRAHGVAAIADEYAEFGDQNNRLADPVVEAMHEAGLYGMFVPRCVRGGAELDPVSSLQVIENVAYGDPSAAWVMMAAALANGTGAAYLGQAAVDDLFGGERMPIIVGQGTRPGIAVRRDGGFLLSGRWSFASGIRHGTHVHTLAAVENSGETRIFVLPVEQVRLIDNWDVLGLRGTGSIDYTIDSVFVPESHSHLSTTEAPQRGGGMYRLGVIGFSMICHAGWACGIGRRLLDELSKTARESFGRARSQSSSDSFLEKFARAEMTFRAAHSLVFETWADVSASLLRDQPLTVRQHSMIRGSMAHVTWTAQETAQFAYAAAGTKALRSGTLQRLFRDIHAGTQHIACAPSLVQTVGRELGGFAAGKKWLFMDLVDA